MTDSHTPIDTDSNPDSSDALAQVLAYHQRTKHRFGAYASGPGALDWDAQPTPFRHFDDAARLPLPLVAELLQPTVCDQAERWHLLLQRPLGAPAPFSAEPNVAALGALLNLALGITAWKSFGPDRWALRANPSSGNLHPVEAYIVSSGCADIGDGIHHYDPLDHALEQRATFANIAMQQGLFIGLTSVMWREAWKYGERAFRYCQLDVGHAAAAIAYAADRLGWRVIERRDLTSVQLAALLGVDRDGDFPGQASSEREEPELLLQLLPSSGEDVVRGVVVDATTIAILLATAHDAEWHGTASTIDRRPFYRWPVIDAVAIASRHTQPERCDTPPVATAMGIVALRNGSELILGRRSAQRFDGKTVMPLAGLQQMVDALLPQPAGTPWQALSGAPRIALVLFIHRVDGVTPGIYLLPRSPQQREELPALLPSQFSFSPLPQLPALQLLAELEPQLLKRGARSLHCHQDIGASACLALGMLARFDEELALHPTAYRDLLREAGLIGQVLYLQAEAIGLRGTGIGCYFDDPVHQFIGLTGNQYQSLYHFTIGAPLDDTRIESSPAYPQRHSPAAMP